MVEEEWRGELAKARRSRGKQRRRWWLTCSREMVAMADNRSSGGGGLYSCTREERGWNGSVARCSHLVALGIPEWDDTRALQAEVGRRAVASASMG
jgi:hypothetical protein